MFIKIKSEGKAEKTTHKIEKMLPDKKRRASESLDNRAKNEYGKKRPSLAVNLCAKTQKVAKKQSNLMER